jgi:hypothetical protein
MFLVLKHLNFTAFQYVFLPGAGGIATEAALTATRRDRVRCTPAARGGHREQAPAMTLAAPRAGVRRSWCPVRHYAEQVQRPLTAADVTPIARGQLAAEALALAQWRETWGPVAEWPPLVLDTDLVSTTVYAEHYYGACPAWIMAEARERLAPLYLLCEPDRRGPPISGPTGGGARLRAASATDFGSLSSRRAGAEREPPPASAHALAIFALEQPVAESRAQRVEIVPVEIVPESEQRPDPSRSLSVSAVVRVRHEPR